MSDKEILKKTLKKAVNNGWVWKDLAPAAEDLKELVHVTIRLDYINRLIFNHDFAKAFWGEEKSKEKFSLDIHFSGHGTSKFIPEWQYHLCMMVLEEEPLKYLEKFI